MRIAGFIQLPGVDAALARSPQIQKQIARAITETVVELRKEAPGITKRNLDKPTAFTLRGFAFERATTQRMQASVFVLPKQAEYLRFSEEGGPREPEGGPRRKTLPRPRGAARTSEGNLKLSVRRIMQRTIEQQRRGGTNEQLRAFGKNRSSARVIAREQSTQSKRDRRREYGQKRRSMKGEGRSNRAGRASLRGYFVGTPGWKSRPDGPAGLWRREGRRVRLLISFDRKFVYRPQYDLKNEWSNRALALAPELVRQGVLKVLERARRGGGSVSLR